MRGANEKQYYNGSGLSSIRPANQNTYKEWLAKPKGVSSNVIYPCFPHN